jgi:hypothetical protein
MKPLDFVKTKQGNIAIITETNDEGSEASLEFIGNGNPHLLSQNINEKSAWWDANELTVIDSLPYLLSRTMAHPFGEGADDAEHFFSTEPRDDDDDDDDTGEVI